MLLQNYHEFHSETVPEVAAKDRTTLPLNVQEGLRNDGFSVTPSEAQYLIQVWCLVQMLVDLSYHGNALPPQDIGSDENAVEIVAKAILSEPVKEGNKDD